MRSLMMPLLLAAAVTVTAAEPTPPPVPERLQQMLQQLVPGRAPDSVTATPLPGIYEVIYGTQLVYLNGEGRYLFKGDLIDLSDGTNLTEQRKGAQRLAALAALSEDSMIHFPATGEVRHTVTIFTDIDCGYCRKLHDGMAEMNRLGISVNYLAFPRAGVGSDSYNRMASAWCADDKAAALTALKQGETIPPRQCEHPLDEHLALVRQFGLTGTPAIVLESGDLLPGYLPPPKLLALLEAER